MRKLLTWLLSGICLIRIRLTRVRLLLSGVGLLLSGSGLPFLGMTLRDGQRKYNGCSAS